MAAESGRLLAGQGKRSKASQMKSPEKKKARKSTNQAAGFSHLTEFAPPPTPMVDHLVASNPFDDDFGPPSRPSGTGGPGSAPFLPSPGAGGGGGYGGGGRMGVGMGFMGGPGGPGGGQPGRRPPFGPPSNAGPHHQLGFGGMPGFGGGGGGAAAGEEVVDSPPVALLSSICHQTLVHRCTLGQDSIPCYLQGLWEVPEEVGLPTLGLACLPSSNTDRVDTHSIAHRYLVVEAPEGPHMAPCLPWEEWVLE
ncbi:hypothetical protein PBY51_005046 [Eleginops maclovinus]|uniref:Uncharacterized protein n=1 Tax=Eleginops maclovinus TaxID=56733 RepID=A0AAN8AG99_ELEMC|nr:hypothetical protein PBY51_005046 [Eleginops maclovinus]